MATALPSNTKCSICFENLNTSKILSCGHPFCHECLVKCIDDRKGTFSCPVCTFPHGCLNHSKKEVEYYCQTCSLGLCSKCILKDHKDHQFLDVECESTREIIVEELSKNEQVIKDTIEELGKDHTSLLETSKKLKSFCEMNEIKQQLDEKESELTEARQEIMTRIQNTKTDLDASCPKTTEEPCVTLIYSLTKLQDLQKRCENELLTDIPTATYEELREGNVKFCDIWVSTVTKSLYQSSEGSGYIGTVTYPRQLLKGSTCTPISTALNPRQLLGGSGPITTAVNPLLSEPITTVFKPPHQFIESDEPKTTVNEELNYKSSEESIPITAVKEKLNQFNEFSDPITTVIETNNPSCKINEFKFNYKDIERYDNWCESGYDYNSGDIVFSCKVMKVDRCLCIYIGLRRGLHSRNTVNYSVTILNISTDKNLVKTMSNRYSQPCTRTEIKVQWDRLTDPSHGFIDYMGQFTVRIDILF